MDARNKSRVPLHHLIDMSIFQHSPVATLDLGAILWVGGGGGLLPLSCQVFFMRVVGMKNYAGSKSMVSFYSWVVQKNAGFGPDPRDLFTDLLGKRG